MIITKDWIMAHKTARGSWNAKQLKCLGIDWPAPKGWIQRAVGTVISTLDQNRFEILAGEPAKDNFKALLRDANLQINQLERELAEIKRGLNNG